MRHISTNKMVTRLTLNKTNINILKIQIKLKKLFFKKKLKIKIGKGKSGHVPPQRWPAMGGVQPSPKPNGGPQANPRGT
jgi:hypothetical protein